MCIREPRANRNRVLWVEYVRRGRIIDDDCFLQVSSYLGQVLLYVSSTQDIPVFQKLTLT